MQVTLHNRVKAYNLTAGKSLPEWLSERRKHRRGAGDEGRVELLHDLDFPHCARCIFRCANGTHLFAAGDYPYRLKCFDVNELSMKFSFNADMQIMSGVCLSPDYRKFALRGQGRQLTVHHSAAIVERLRVPHIQRCLAYHRYNAELLSSGASHEVYRISLETGAFVESYHTRSVDGVNHVEVCEKGPASGVVLTAGCDGALEAWDGRSQTCAARLQVAGATGGSGGSTATATTTACEMRHVAAEQSGAGMLFACGLESGEVVLYDIRLHRPLLVKDHMNGLPIVKSYFFQGRSVATGEASHVVSADTRSLKVWSRRDGSNFTSLDAPGDVTDFCVLRSVHNLVPPYECDDSGVVALCCDVPRVQVHFIPQLGAAPRWASFLEVMTDELASSERVTVYDDYTFITRDEMRTLGIAADDVAGGKVRPVMHGAFIENSLYRELKAVVDPAAFSRYVADRAKQRSAARWSDRISRFRRTEAHDEANDNDDNADHHKATAAAAAASARQSSLAMAKADPRFAKAFDATTGKATPAFALDRSNPEYAKLLQTIDERRAKANARRQRYEAELFAVVPEDDGAVAEANAHGDGNSSSRHAGDATARERAGDHSDDEDARVHLRGVQSSGKPTRKRGSRVGKDNDNNNNKNKSKSKSAAHKDSTSRDTKVVTMYDVKRAPADAFTRNDKQLHALRKKMRAEKLTLEERLRRMQSSSLSSKQA